MKELIKGKAKVNGYGHLACEVKWCRGNARFTEDLRRICSKHNKELEEEKIKKLGFEKSDIFWLYCTDGINTDREHRERQRHDVYFKGNNGYFKCRQCLVKEINSKK